MPWATMAAVLVIARLCEPSSELHIAEDWFRRTALDDLLACPRPRSTTTGCIARWTDCCRTRRRWRASQERLGELFELDYDLLLYDVTSTYFEGQAEANPLAQRGYSRDHRPDCKQVCIGLVVTREGFPLGYEVFAGNRTTSTTVEEIVETMESALRPGGPHLGDGPRHDQRRESGVAARHAGGAISSWARPRAS